MQKLRVGIIGATGMVGQRFITLLKDHPWFSVSVLAASSKSAGKKYGEATEGRWLMDSPMPQDVANLVLYDAQADAAEIVKNVDFVFCAVDLPHDETKAFEEMYAKLECPVVSNNSAHRGTPDVPMVIPEINPQHLDIIPFQQKRLNTKRGFIAVKSNCSLQSYVPTLHALKEYGLEKALVCTYQAISGAGKNFDTWPEMLDNVIPYIGGEEEKSEKEPMKIWGTIKDGEIVNASKPDITAQCLRVPVTNGHMAAVFASFKNKPEIEKIKQLWCDYKGEAQLLNLPSAPKQYIHYFEEVNFPQTRLHRDLEKGMAVGAGRLRCDKVCDIKFVSLSHNTIRGAAGGAVLLAELLYAKKYIKAK